MKLTAIKFTDLRGMFDPLDDNIENSLVTQLPLIIEAWPSGLSLQEQQNKLWYRLSVE